LSKLGCTELFFVQPGVKVNGDYYRESTAVGEAAAMHQGNILWQFHIPTGQCTCAQGAWHNRTFTPRDARLYFSLTVAPNTPDMNPVDYKIWAVMQERVYEKRVNDVDELCQRLLSVAQH